MLNKGYTLLELMMVLLITLIVLSSFSMLSTTFFGWTQNLVLLIERDANLALTPLLLAQWIQPAGHHRWPLAEAGIEIQDDTISIQADIDGPNGFPDQRLESSFERIILRQDDGNLELKSGEGSFQPFLKNIEIFQPGRESVDLVSIQIQAVTDQAVTSAGLEKSPPLSVRFQLWNFESTLFPTQLPD